MKYDPKAVVTLAMWRLVAALPEAVGYKLLERMFARQVRPGAKQHARLMRTFAPILPPEKLEDSIAEIGRWYSRYWAEAFRLPRLSSEELHARISCDGCEHIDNALAEGRGAVFATLHQGNWDAGGAWAAGRWPVSAVAEVLEPRAVFERFLEYRQDLGIHVIPLERGVDVTSLCIEEINRNRLVALLADRDMTGSGIPVQFFDKTAKMAPGPAVVAARTGAPILPVVIYQAENSTFRAEVRPPLPQPADDSAQEIAKTTQAMAEIFQEFIEAAPTQWHMFQEFWPESV